LDKKLIFHCVGYLPSDLNHYDTHRCATAPDTAISPAHLSH
jgi:hypothetical protein